MTFQRLLHLFCFSLLITALGACGDKCKDVYCGQYGSCDEGVCICSEGYEQDSEGACSIAASAKFLGNYRVNEQCNITQEEYFVDITESSTNATTINISNLYGFSNNVVSASVDGNNLTIASQITADGFEVEGSGTLNNTNINLDFTITRVSDGANDVCSLVMVLQ